MPNAYISGTGHYVPPRVVTNDDLVNTYGIETSHEWIVKRTGIEARRYSEEGVGTAELGFEASTAALESAGLEIRDIDMIVFATLSPDYCFPGSGVLLQRMFGVADGPTEVHSGTRRTEPMLWISLRASDRHFHGAVGGL